MLGTDRQTDGWTKCIPIIPSPLREKGLIKLISSDRKLTPQCTRLMYCLHQSLLSVFNPLTMFWWVLLHLNTRQLCIAVSQTPSASMATLHNYTCEECSAALTKYMSYKNVKNCKTWINLSDHLLSTKLSNVPVCDSDHSSFINFAFFTSMFNEKISPKGEKKEKSSRKLALRILVLRRL